MPAPTPPRAPDHDAARRVAALWSAWLDPLDLAFEELEADAALEALRRRLTTPSAPAGSKLHRARAR
jgi:hypothetical protein